MILRIGHFGLSRVRQVRPEYEKWKGGGGCYWHLTAFGLSLWYDSLPPVTVGDRGVW